MARATEHRRAMPKDQRVDAYIEASADFARPILSWLRDRVHAAVPETTESIKWSRPAFLISGRTFALMVAFKNHARFGLWEHGAAEGETAAQFRHLLSLADLPDAPTLEAMIRATALRAERGERRAHPPRARRPEAEVPAELAAALAGDAAADATFRAFPPSCRREYCEWIEEARRPETRARRVAEAIEWMREGKRRNWKYAKGAGG